MSEQWYCLRIFLSTAFSMSGIAVLTNWVFFCSSSSNNNNNNNGGDDNDNFSICAFPLPLLVPEIQTMTERWTDILCMCVCVRARDVSSLQFCIVPWCASPVHSDIQYAYMILKESLCTEHILQPGKIMSMCPFSVINSNQYTNFYDPWYELRASADYPTFVPLIYCHQ